MRNPGKYIPLITGSGVLFFLTTIVFFECLKVTDGKFIYILDDAYIHLAYAKNIVLNNVWGVTQYENSSSSSSPLWTLILVGVFLITGVNEFIPLIVNMLLALILITIIFFLFKQYSLSVFYATCSILAIIILTPVTINIFTGMEHLLQAIFVILFIFLSVKILTIGARDSNRITKEDIGIFVLSALLATVRYEDLFTIFVITFLFLIQKKFLKAFLIILCGIIPLLIFGLISVSNGGYIIPNSVLMKSFLPELIKIFSETNVNQGLVNYFHNNEKIIFLFIVSLTLFILQVRLNKKFWSEIPLLLFIIISLILLHKISFSLSFFRYDVYLVITCFVINAIALFGYLIERFQIKINFGFVRKSKIALIIFIIFSFFLAYKSFDSQYIIIASKNIYGQQYQMSLFLKTFYNGDGVALNDIGAVNYFADVRCMDLIGIGSNEVAGRKLENNFQVKDIREMAESKNLRIAILYESWFENMGVIPSGWEKAGMWKIQNNFICGDDEVSIYALNPDEKEELIRNLKSFSNDLPASVIQSGEYLHK